MAARIRKGDRVVVLHPPSIDFVSSLLGCMIGGTIGVPVAPARRRHFDGRIVLEGIRERLVGAPAQGGQHGDGDNKSCAPCRRWPCARGQLAGIWRIHEPLSRRADYIRRNRTDHPIAPN